MEMSLDEICYHHFSLTFNMAEIERRFQDVRFVLVAGCARRAQAQADFLATHLAPAGKECAPVERLTKPSSRFALFKVGPVLVANHGMGPASMSIALHELLLMCKQAHLLDLITLIRFGTYPRLNPALGVCHSEGGGIGVDAGTVCITTKALNSLLEDFVELNICLKRVRRPCIVDGVTAGLLQKLALEHPNEQLLGSYQVRSGATVGTNDFYEEQGRTNGAICDHSQADKARFLDAIREAGVINMEMESNYLAAMCHKLRVSFGIICVALNNRLISDKVELSSERMGLFERRLFWLNYQLIRHKLSTSK